MVLGRPFHQLSWTLGEIAISTGLSAELPAQLWANLPAQADLPIKESHSYQELECRQKGVSHTERCLPTAL